MKTILFTQGHASQRAVVRLARAAFSHADLRVLASHCDDREDILEGADEALVEPARPDPRAEGAPHAEWLLDRARSLGVGAILAMRNRTALVEARETFAAAGIRVACGATSREALETCERKDVFAARLREAGLPVPETIAVVDEAGLAHALASLEGAEGGVCVKPASGVYGRGFWRLDPNADAFAHLEDPDRRVVHPGVFVSGYAQAREKGRLVAMEYLPGDEYSVDVVCDEGRLVAAAARRKTGAFQVVTTRGPEVDLAAAVVAELRLDGLVNVQTRADARGRPKVLEVNTRYSGGIGYSAAAGVNLPAIAAATLLGVAAPRDAFGVEEPRAVRIVDEPVFLPRTSARLAAGPPAQEQAA
ncbi:ATP-grasp domain-containing protein [Salinarimonas ramus]|uniref:Carboxylate--amine ligase n=1 Tax=Salinarimonas ramus TaxID=690164 RepID=A0A917Q4D0_9HYPH|nr:ATP-grasp domain-containing protein [Salinarimonas ramus]GGK19945.1 carboxylate--amine ligase [Salinarimonas ramus]